MLIQWLGNSCEALYELPVMANKAKEGSYLSACLWWCILGNGCQICIARLNTSFGHLMSQIIYFLLKEIALQQI